MCIVGVFLDCTSGVHGQDLRSEKVLEWDFQRGDDRNLDLEPDGWRRRRDRQHPIYIKAKIVSRDEEKSRRASEEQMFIAKLMYAYKVGKWHANYVPEVIPPSLADIMDRYAFQNCLEIRMDGAAAEMVSPPFPVDPRFSYSLRAEASTQGLDGHRTWIELQLLDAQQQPIEILTTDSLTRTSDWRQLSTSIATDTTENLKWGRVHLKVEPSAQLLISGVARFDSICVYRLPRLTLQTDREHHLVRPGESFDVVCQAMGIPIDSKSVQFELKNFQHEPLQSESIALEKIEWPGAEDRQVPEETPTAANEHFVSTKSTQASTSSDGEQEVRRMVPRFYDGRATWTLQLDTPGLYYVDVCLGAGGSSQRRQLRIGVIPDYGPINAGPFGWSIQQFDASLTPEKLPGLAARFGAGWVKYPVWFDQYDLETANAMVTMTERLQAHGAHCIGKIDQPPATQREIFGEGTDPLHAVALLRDPKAWEPVLDPVLTRMGLKLDWFQLGGDSDMSFQNHSNVVELLSEIRARMQTYSQELKLAVCWEWDTPEISDTNKPWNAVQYSASPALTAAELGSYTESLKERSGTAWVRLDPLPMDRYSVLDRVRDLTERMIVIKKNAVDAAFLTNPFDSNNGILEPDLTVGEMLLPWTTLVAAIGDKRYIGSFSMPGSSINHCFEGEKDAVMLVWNESPTTETLFLGKDVTVTDVWGAAVKVEVTNEHGFEEQRLQVGRWPLIVRGIDAGVVRWRQDFQVAVANLASTVGDRQLLPVEFVNGLSHSGTGTMTVISDSLLGETRSSVPFQVAQGAQTSLNIPLQTRADASAGKHHLRFDVDINAGEPYRFSIYRNVTLGTDEIEFRWEPNRKGEDQVEVRLELVNNTTQPTSFDCRFFPVGQPYQRFLINNAQPGSTMSDIVLKIGPEDIKQGAWLRCEEVGTGRVLNYRLKL